VPRDTANDTGLAVTIGQHAAAAATSGSQDFHGALVPDGAALALKGVVLAVADGISPSPVSRAAAGTAVKALMTDYYATPEAWTVKTAASRVIAATNAWLHAASRRAGTAGGDRGMVTTLSALILKGRAAHVFHVGDSRVWRLSGAGLEPLTEDHRVALAGGQSYLGRAMGAAPDVEIDHTSCALAVGDVFVLTTDGVHDTLAPRTIARKVRAHGPTDAAARAIADAARATGADDDLTVQIVRIDALPSPDAAGPWQEAVSLPLPSLPQPGAEIDGFRILRVLHATARSHVFLAAAPDGTRVALKVPATGMRDDPAYLRRFAMEDWIARRIVSPHVLEPGPLPERRTALYVATRFVEGRTLRQWMHDTSAPSLAQVRDIVEQLVRGLRAFHRREMIHQDLRPENVLIDDAGTVRIIDFGSVRVAGVQEAAPGPDDGAVPGTYQYTAPEYLSGDVVSWRADLYSLGVIAYEMLNGRLPYGADVARVRTRADQRRLRYRPAPAGDNAVPDWMDAALARAVHPDPLKRFDALSEFTHALRAPPPGWRAARRRPLAQRDPVRFWQAVAASLAVIVLILTVRLTT